MKPKHPQKPHVRGTNASDRESRDFLNELIGFLGNDQIETIDDLIHEISQRSYHDDRSRNIVFQYLRKIAKQHPDHREKIYRSLSCLKRSKFKAFKINLASAFCNGGRFEGALEIHIHYFNILRLVCKSELSLLTHIKRINIQPFLIAKDLELTVNDQVRPKEEFELLTRGCGSSGCCESLYWNVSHHGDKVIIKDIFWGGLGYKPEEKIQHVVGEFTVNKQDFVSEIERLEGIYKRSKEKGRETLWKMPSLKRR